MEKIGQPGKIDYGALLVDLGFDPQDFEIVDKKGITKPKQADNQSPMFGNQDKNSLERQIRDRQVGQTIRDVNSKAKKFTMTTEDVRKSSKAPPPPQQSQGMSTATQKSYKVFQEPGDDATECTFRPKINPISRSMATYLQPLHTEEGISFYIERKNRNLKLLREKIERDHIVKCPECAANIYGSKERLAKREDGEELIADRLYQVGMRMVQRRQEKVEQFVKEEFPFQPNNEKSVKDKGSRSISNFLKRNEEDCRKRVLRQERVMLCEHDELGAKYYNAVDKKYRPKSRQPSERNPDDIGKDLYHKGLEMYKAHAEKAKRALTPPPQNAKTKAANEKYIKKMMSRRFEDIFFLLDGQKTGSVSAKNVNLEALNPTLVKLMSPMLYELEDFDLNLDVSQFVRACNNLFQSLSFYDRRLFLNSPLRSGDIKEADMTADDISVFSKGPGMH